jgi:hypothetical protein
MQVTKGRGQIQQVPVLVAALKAWLRGSADFLSYVGLILSMNSPLSTNVQGAH